MTKMELARKQAEHMAEISNGRIDVERATKNLYKNMTTRELEKAIAHWSK